MANEKIEKQKREVAHKPIYVCIPANGKADFATASGFTIVSGPFDDRRDAINSIKNGTVDGVFKLMYEGPEIKRSTEKITKVEIV